MNTIIDQNSNDGVKVKAKRIQDLKIKGKEVQNGS